VVPSDRTRCNGRKLKQRILHQNIKKHFFTVMVTKHWHRLPRKIVESRSPEVFTSCLDMILGNQLGVALCEQGELDQMPSRGAF